MPVGTQGTVKTLSQADLRSIGVQIILNNAYYLYLRPGHKLIEKAGGLHRFMGWERPILTDSGGYQVFSLADLSKVTEDGVIFQSHFDGSRHLFTPERVIEIEHCLGADIIMSFDECTPYPCSYDYARRSAEMTLRWAERCLSEHERLSSGGDDAERQALFGIVQGSVYRDIREFSARNTAEMSFDGYAIGGLAVGEPKATMWDMVDTVLPYLPEERPRYLMGIGYPEDLIEAVRRGIDMFDCVIPTRNSRNGTVFTRFGKMTVKNSQYAEDFSPIDDGCPCETCRNYTRAYIRHLFQSGEILALRLATLHSVYFFMSVMEGMRRSIIEGRFSEWSEEFFRNYAGSGENVYKR